MPSSESPTVLVVLLNWNNAPETEAAVQSLLGMDYAAFRILIVDNLSSDDSFTRLQPLAASDPRIELLQSGANLGYTGGCNLGFRHALQSGVPYIWLLNSDAVTAPDTLSSLVALAESDPRIGLATPLIAALDPPHQLTFAGGILDLPSGTYNETNDLEVARQWAQDFPESGLVIGTAMLVRTEMLRQIGLFDESLFMYFEDVDLSARSLKAAWRNVVDSASTVFHPEKNRDKDPLGMRPHYWYYLARNESRFWRKHLSPSRSLRLSWWSFNSFLRHRNRLLAARPDSAHAILAGLWHGWLGRSGPFSTTFRMPALPALAVGLYARRAALQPKLR